MAENSKIEWTSHTFNPWRGCTKVSPGCRNCYAETLSGRNPKTLGVWGPQGTRVVAAESAWKEPLKWDRQAGRAGERHRVFCASLADVFEDWQGPMETSGGFQLWKRTVPVESAPGVTGELYGRKWTTSDHYRDTVMLTMGDVRARLFDLIRQTPHLDWLLLTKRPENVGRFLDDACWPETGCPMFSADDPLPPNVWLGTSVEDRQRADGRIPELLSVPAAVRFLSCEPLLGPVDLSGYMGPPETPALVNGLHWVIVGGESGPGARPCHVEWVRSIVQQCRSASVPVFVKQLGKAPTASYYDDFRREWEDQRGWEWPDANDWNHRDGQPPLTSRVTLPLIDKKGGDMEEWPADLRIREFPTVQA